jgi:hypothetical protein
MSRISTDSGFRDGAGGGAAHALASAAALRPLALTSDLIQEKSAFTMLTLHIRLIKKEESTSQHVLIEIELPKDLEQFQLLEGVNMRLRRYMIA